MAQRKKRRVTKKKTEQSRTWLNWNNNIFNMDTHELTGIANASLGFMENAFD